MLKMMDIGKIIGMKEAGMSNREINRRTGYAREKIREVWERYRRLMERMGEEGADIRALQAEMEDEPKYKARARIRTKYTEELAERLKEIVEAEEAKKRRLGKTHKQKLSNRQIHAKLEAEGFDISRVTINVELAKIRQRLREVFIRQEYDLGDRLEYDFGEVTLNCGEGYKVYHMAVFSSPGSNFRWSYLYTNQKQGVFLDSKEPDEQGRRVLKSANASTRFSAPFSTRLLRRKFRHVKFFEMMGGAWKEVVYDNMKNVVHKFIGRSEKELNPELVKMAAYYGYQINVTNCYKGNEKGHVENSVKVLRNQIFAERDSFASLLDAREYLLSQLLKLNVTSGIEEEKKCLLPGRPPLELASIHEAVVNSYAFISVDTALYSVPEHLVGKKVIVKKYHDEIRVYDENLEVCRHERAFGNGTMKIDIRHYLNTLLKKTGAVVALFEEKTRNPGEIAAIEVIKPATGLEVNLRSQIVIYKLLVNAGVGLNGGNIGSGGEAAASVHAG